MPMDRQKIEKCKRSDCITIKHHKINIYKNILKNLSVERLLVIEHVT